MTTTVTKRRKPAIQVIENALEEHSTAGSRGWLWALKKAAQEPVKAMQDFWIAHGWKDYEDTDEESMRVFEMNKKLDSCHSCIAPEALFEGDDESTIEAAIAHFDGLAADCIQYSADLQKILNRRF